jgi:hypothetical protein
MYRPTFFYFTNDTGPLSPMARSSETKRAQTSPQVVVSFPEKGFFGVDIKLMFAHRDIGVHGLSQDQPADSLLSLLKESPYNKVLSNSTWIEFPRCHPLPEDWEKIISGCWFANPILNYATAVLFAGCVLYNPNNRRAVLCLVAESYARAVDIDVHCEKSVTIGANVISSQPSAFGLYPHAAVCHIVRDTKDHRLVLGCKSFNILFTEVWRLDQDCTSQRGFTAGCCSSTFPDVGIEDVKIFIDKRSFDLALSIATGKYPPPFDICFLRQIRSHLCSEHSYRMGRAMSFLIANMVSAQAASIWTLSLIFPGSGDPIFGSMFLSAIAREVHSNGQEAVLRKSVLKKLLDQVKPEKSCKEYAVGILSLFENKDEIKIFGNDTSFALEGLLDNIAECVFGGLAACNKKVETQLAGEMSRQSW